MKFSLAQILLLTTSSAHTLLQDNDIEADLTEDLRIQMSKWDAKKLDRFFGEAIEDAEDDWKDASRDYVRWKRSHRGHDGKSKEELDELMTKEQHEMMMKARAAADAAKARMEMKHGADSDRYRKHHDRDYISRNQAYSIAMHDWVNSMTKDLYGWTLEEKFKQMKFKERYMPLIQEVMKSKEFKSYTHFAHEFFRNPKIRQIAREVEWLGRDLERFPASDFRIEPPKRRTSHRRHDDKRDSSRTGPRKCDRHGKCHDGADMRKERERDYMSRAERRQLYKHTYYGVDVDFEDVRSVGEDIEHIWGEIEHLLDPKNPLTAKGIKLDAQLRFSPAVQKLIKMFMKDLGVKSPKDLEHALERLAKRAVSDIRKCPYFRRLRLSVERWVRYFAKHVRISNLPRSGSHRAAWTQKLTYKLYYILKRGDSVKNVYKFMGNAIEDSLHEVEKYMNRVEKIQQTYNKSGGI